MTMPTRQETAKIYQFPVRYRPQATIDRVAPRHADSRKPYVTSTDFGSGWYHEAAMQESQQDRKH